MMDTASAQLNHGRTYRKSEKWWRSAAAIPGRSHTRSKAPGRLFDVGRGPLYAKGGSGALLFDVDGHVYIDMVCALGAVSLGYGAAQSPKRAGVVSLPLGVEVEASQAMMTRVAPWASWVRMLRTGSEATHAAYRVAKAATGRPKVLVGNWAYHGWHEWCSSPYTDSGGTQYGTTISYTKPDDLFTLLQPNTFAAVFVEPPRWHVTDASWYQRIRDFCDQHGVLLVFDEMIYGGRWALGGATEYFDVRPDLACFGKALWNGASGACVVGREALAAHGELVSGTYAGDGDAAQALIDTLQTYATQPVVQTLWERGSQLAAGIDAAIEATGWKGDVVREGMPVHQRLRFRRPELGREFAARMAALGVLWHPEVVNVCYAHSREQIEAVIGAVRLVLAHAR